MQCISAFGFIDFRYLKKEKKEKETRPYKDEVIPPHPKLASGGMTVLCGVSRGFSPTLLHCVEL